jgi:hypothetical protein
LATWALNTGSDGNNTGARLLGNSSGQAFSMNRSLPVIPLDQRGPDNNFNAMLITGLTVQVAGPSGAVNVRARIWNSTGSHVRSSSAVSAPSNSTFSIGNVNFTFDPVILSAGSWRWGVWSIGDFRVQTSTNSSFNVYNEVPIASSGNWTGGNNNIHPNGSGFSLVGSIEYFLVPTPPTVSSGGSTTSSVTVNWTAPSNDGGKSISGYVVEYKPNFSSTWTLWTTASSSSRSSTISGLSSSTTYDVRVAAQNEVSLAMNSTSEYGTTSITTGFVSTFSFSPAPATTTVPNLNGLTLTQANTSLSNASLNSSANPVTSGATAANNNLVIDNSQSPGAGSVVNTGTTVSFNYYSYVPPAQKVSVWNGTSWVISTPKIWNGTSWVDPAVIRVWNGTSWVNPT